MKRLVAYIACAVLAVGFAAGLATQVSAAGAYQNYVALGDSVAAGAGLPLASNQGEDLLCARSGEAYPHAVAARLGTQVTQLACSGAKIDEGIYGRQEINGTGLEPQLDRAFAHGTPDLITLTIGANDARWAQFVGGCYAGECGSKRDNLLAKMYLADVRLELHRTMYKINKLSKGDPPRVMVTGYFNPISPGPTLRA